MSFISSDWLATAAKSAGKLIQAIIGKFSLLLFLTFCQKQVESGRAHWKLKEGMRK